MWNIDCENWKFSRTNVTMELTIANCYLLYLFVYLQHITNDANGPHIGAVANLVEVDDFRSDELWCSEENLQLFLRVVEPS